jgi:ABC-type thiamine transport system substrate-binding protein
MLKSVVQEFATRFRESHGLALKFTDEAMELLINQAIDQDVQVRDLCVQKFKDYQFGLKLIATNTGQVEFVMDRAAVETPDKTLSDWVVASYRDKPEPPPKKPEPPQP